MTGGIHGVVEAPVNFGKMAMHIGLLGSRHSFECSHKFI